MNDLPKAAMNKLLEVPGLLFVLGSFIAFFTAFLPSNARDPYVHITIGTLSFIFGYILLRKPKTNIAAAKYARRLKTLLSPFIQKAPLPVITLFLNKG
ncbi:hypothetical protein LCGC14_2794880 [marine sediment metagenome]|uniref:Uncharacterized protein n=1 Tax=marine sediment metagenome TaxID=412755 RepID=A0A0F8ZBH0_9ZZZZ